MNMDDIIIQKYFESNGIIISTKNISDI